jgi:hypothetical protein
MNNRHPVKWQPSKFGDYLDFEFPNGCNAIIVGVHKHQFVPVSVLLPHQAYRERLADILREHDATEVYILAYRSEDVMSFDLTSLRTSGVTA